jgi:O-antigen/teichoic acid export membrane protein
VGVALFAFVLEYSDSIALFFGTDRLSSILTFIAPLILVHSVAIAPKAFQQKQMQFGRRGVVTVASELANTCVAVFAALAGYGFWSLVYGAIARGLTLLCLSWVLSDPKEWFRLTVPQWAIVKSLLTFGTQSTVFGLLVFFNNMWHNLLLGRVLGAAAVGHYSRAWVFASMPLEQGVQPLGGILFPAYARIQDDRDRVRDGYLRGIRMLSLATFPALTGLYAVSPEIVHGVFGSAWAPMITTLQALSFMSLFRFLPMATSSLYFALGVPRYNVWISAIDAVSTVLLTLIAVPYGIFWVAVASAVGRAIGAAYSLKALNTLLPGIWSGLVQATKAPALGSSVMVLGIWASRPLMSRWFSNAQGPEALASLVLIGALLYLGSVALLDRGVIKLVMDVWKAGMPRAGRSAK